jgi:hypothetical protein
MSVLRAFLGRFARFLVRIARRLDPSLTATPYWVMPERMAMLRLRYPGAPEHWLELVARRITTNNLTPPVPPAVESRTSAVINEPAFPTEERAVSRQPSPGPSNRPAHREVTRFRPIGFAAQPKSRPVAAFVKKRPASRDSATSGKRTGSAPTYASAPVRSPIANLVRIELRTGRPPPIRFDLGDSRPSPRALPPIAQQDFVRNEHHPVFPELEAHEVDRPDWIRPSETASDSDGDRPEHRWPEPHRSGEADARWLDGRANAERPNPHFSARDNRWPDLPRLDDESAARIPVATDEAALIAEQIGGTWSA